MDNKKLSDHLNTIADYYIIANDLIRTRAFRSAATNVNLVTFEITKQNFKDVKFNGLGETTLEVIKQFVDTGNSNRYQELKQKYPPRSVLSLLSLFNFDLQYILELWNKYKVTSVADIYTLKEPRVVKAIKALEDISPNASELPQHDYKLIGDCVIHTAFCSGQNTIGQIVEKLKELGDKHIFVADKLASSNVLAGMSPDRLATQRDVIKQAQIDNDIRIWQGAIVDIDLDGNLIAPRDILQKVEYLVIKPSTLPHTNILTRLDSALSKIISKDNIVIDCLDIYCNHLDQKQFQELLIKHDPILLLPGADLLTYNYITVFLSKVKLTRVALASCANSFSELDNIVTAANAAKKLNIKSNCIVNCLPKPFAKVITPESRIGVRYSKNLENKIPEPTSMEKIEAAMKKIEKLRSASNSLGSVFQRNKK